MAFGLKRGVVVPVVWLAIGAGASFTQGCGDDDATSGDATSDAGTSPTATTIPTSTSTVPDDSGPGTGDAAAEDAAAPTPVRIALAGLGPDRFHNVAFDAAGNAYAVGNFSDSVDATDDIVSIVVKFTPAGERDNTFGTQGVAKVNLAVGARGEVTRGIVVQADNKIVIAGTAEHPGGDSRDRDAYVARLNTNGTLDTTFNGGANGGIKQLDVGTGVVSGSSLICADAQWGFARGPSDSLFVSLGACVTGRTDTDYTIVKLTKDGAPDTGFNLTGFRTIDVGNANLNTSVRNITALPDGSVVASGYMTVSDVIVPVVLKVNADGSLPASSDGGAGFATNGIFDKVVLDTQAEAYTAVPQGTSFVTTGYGKVASADPLSTISFRLNQFGDRDLSYGTDGLVKFQINNLATQSRGIVVLPDQRVVFLGVAQPTAGNQDAFIALYSKDGQPVTSFGPNGVRTFELGGIPVTGTGDQFWGGAVSPDNKRVAIVGTAGPKTDAGNDSEDSAVFFIPLPQ